MTPSERPSILVVSHLCPFPTTHGNRARLAGLLKRLKSSGFRVTYILQPLDVDAGSGIPSLAEVVDRLEVVSRPSGRWEPMLLLRSTGRRLAGALLPEAVAETLRHVLNRARGSGASQKDTAETGDPGKHGHIDQWCWPATCDAVDRAVRRDNPVAVVVEYALLSKCLERIPASILRVVDTVEVFFRAPERVRVEGAAEPFRCSPESERTALNRADVLVAIQKHDARVLRECFPNTPVITVPHTYAAGRPRSSTPALGTILYVGSSNPFNVHGLQQFFEHAWQSILKLVPTATLRVVGSLPRIDGVEDIRVVYVGRVSDDELAREYQTAHVVINPQTAGTGLKIKCVEALSAGCPLVTNRAGGDGFEDGAGSAFLLAKDWEEFGSQVARVLTDDGVRRRLEVAARQFANEMFSPDVTFSELERVLWGHVNTHDSHSTKSKGIESV